MSFRKQVRESGSLKGDCGWPGWPEHGTSAFCVFPVSPKCQVLETLGVWGVAYKTK